MIICPVCKKENDTFAKNCIGCGGFLQNRIPTLDLFSTSWKVLESPKEAFRIITLAEHKNYSVFLYTLFGIYIFFIETWNLKIGDKFENLLNIIILSLILGIFLGLIFSLLIPTVHWMLVKLFSGKNTFRNSLAVTSYAFIPVILSLILIFPVQLMTFGLYLFTFNPNPFHIKPELYIVLMSLSIISIIWTLVLSIIGTKISCQIELWKAIIIIVILYTLLVLILEIPKFIFINQIS